MHTFSIEKEIQIGETLTLKGKPAHHLIKVLRVKVGEELKIASKSHQLFLAEISSVSKNIELIVKSELNPPLKPYSINLYLSLIKKDKIEWVLQKCVELNIESVHLIKSARSIRTEISTSHWIRFEKIIEESQKQCGRLIPLKIYQPETFQNTLKNLDETKDVNILAYENETKNNLRESLRFSGNRESYNLWIGPEGGWDEKEIEAAKNKFFKIATISPLILRAETAALHVLSSCIAIKYEC